MMRIDQDHEEILARLSEWLTQTAEEIASLDEQVRPMSERPDGPSDGNFAPRGDFAPRLAPSALAPVGLLQVVEALTAMRHEVKLQTKSGRGLEDSVHAARQGLEAAIRQFQSVQAREEESAQRAALPLVEAMAGLDEALWRGARAFEATHRQMTAAAAGEMRRLIELEVQRLPWWRRRLLGPWQANLQQHCAEAIGNINEREFAKLFEGYKLIQDRIARQLQEQGLRRIEAEGRRVDPSCMTVVELADPSEGSEETVVALLRPGYLWRGKVIRFAEVRAVPSRGP